MEFTLSTKDSLADLISRLSPSAEEIHIFLEDGEHSGLERERIFYNLRNPLVIESVSGDRSKCALRSENCEFFHKDTENRAVITFGEKCTSVTLRNFTIENTHIKTAEDVSLGNQAEALCFHCQQGKLFCEGMRLISRQDTIHVKGVSRFRNCHISGDVDYIWGYCDYSLFEKCVLHTRHDNRGPDKAAYVLQSRAWNSRPGFVFADCEFTADDRDGNSRIFIARSQGTGRPDSADRWDSVALINCRISELYNPALWTDENGSRAVYPEKGSASCGWRQFGSKIVRKDGSVEDYDDSLQERHGYTMSGSEAAALLSSLDK